MSVLKGTKNFYEADVSDYVSYNLKSWLEYGLLEIGAFTRVEFSNPGTSGLCTLQSSHDDRYLDGQVYEAEGPGWVWENDVVPINSGVLPPFQASGVYINNAFYPTVSTTGTYAHSLDFQNGKVVFNSPVNLPIGAVQAQYTFRDVAIYLSDSPHWKTIVDQYTKVYPTIAASSPSGMSELLKENRVWLPSVVIDIENRDTTGLQLGGGDYNTFDVAYHIFSDLPFSARRLMDLLCNQFEVSINLFNVENLKFPYSYDGTLVSGALTYPVLANRGNGNFWTFARVKGSDGSVTNSNTNVYRAQCNHSIEVERNLNTF